jgi:tetratricopeptide (TPR) repeat protein
MRKSRKSIHPFTVVLVLIGLVVAAMLIYQVPSVKRRLDWRIEDALAYLRGVVNPVQPMPTPLTVAYIPTSQPTASPTPTSTSTQVPDQPTPTDVPTATPTLTPTPLPPSVALSQAKYEAEDWNSCGPATLAMYLRYYGWQGDQYDISKVVKPVRKDRNVNVDELVYYVRNYAGWLNAEYRVGGDLSLLKAILASGIPVMIEGSTTLNAEDAPYTGDDRWAGHYLLLTGYDDGSQVFYEQDSYHPEETSSPYLKIDQEWQSFNRVYILIYPPDKEETVKSLLGPDWDVDANRQHALDTAQAETRADPNNAFAWFNVGSNLVYFERYTEAAQAYDTARQVGLPHRMLYYQFGPFFAYFHTDRVDDVLALADYVLTLPGKPVIEEPHLWAGWAYYRKGMVDEAIAEWRTALEANPNYQDALYALDFVGASP